MRRAENGSPGTDTEAKITRRSGASKCPRTEVLVYLFIFNLH